MTATTEILLFRDAEALAHYLAGAAQWSPGLLEQPCIGLELEPEPGSPAPGPSDAAPWTFALVRASQAPALFQELAARSSLAIKVPRASSEEHAPVPKPPESGQERTRLVSAEIDLEGKRLKVLGPAKGLLRRTSVAESYAIKRARASSNVVQAAPLQPWAREPEDPELVFLSPMDETFAALVTEHLELGRDGLRFAATVDGDRGPCVLVDVGRPSWFLLERWTERRGAKGERPVLAFRRLPRRRIYVAWGQRHPLEAFVAEPEGDALLFIDDDGRYRTLRAGAWKDVGEVLSWEKVALATDKLEPTKEAGRIPVRLRLERRHRPRDPELWLLKAAERGRLERLLAQTPEEELKNLLVTLVARPDGSRFFLVREVLAGRAARLLPIGGQGYASVPGLPNLFVPCDLTIAPPLRNDRYSRAFGVKPGEITILDEPPGATAGEGTSGASLPASSLETAPSGVAISRVDEASFRPIEAVVDFVVDGDASRLEALIAATPFDLGRYAEEDVVPPGLPAEPAGRRAREAGPSASASDDSDEGPAPAEKARGAPKAPAPRDKEASSRPATPAPREEVGRAKALADLERELAAEPARSRALGSARGHEVRGSRRRGGSARRRECALARGRGRGRVAPADGSPRAPGDARPRGPQAGRESADGARGRLPRRPRFCRARAGAPGPRGLPRAHRRRSRPAPRERGRSSARRAAGSSGARCSGSRATASRKSGSARTCSPSWSCAASRTARCPRSSSAGSSSATRRRASPAIPRAAARPSKRRSSSSRTPRASSTRRTSPPFARRPSLTSRGPTPSWVKPSAPASSPAPRSPTPKRPRATPRRRRGRARSPGRERSSSAPTGRARERLTSARLSSSSARATRRGPTSPPRSARRSRSGSWLSPTRGVRKLRPTTRSSPRASSVSRRSSPGSVRSRSTSAPTLSRDWGKAPAGDRSRGACSAGATSSSSFSSTPPPRSRRSRRGEPSRPRTAARSSRCCGGRRPTSTSSPSRRSRSLCAPTRDRPGS